MKNTFLLLTFIILPALLLYSQKKNPDEVPVMKDYLKEEIQELVNPIVNEFADKNLFMGTVLIAKDKIPVYKKAVGYSNKEKQFPNTIKTKYDIGSIVKDFTSAIILQLMEEGKLKLDDNIGKYINDFSDDILQKVTIRHLLNHTSGFDDYLRNPDFDKISSELKSVESIINYVKDDKLIFDPGTEQSYSNTGFAVLGAIIESITGKSYFDVVEQKILEPLKMENTLFDWKEIANSDNKSTGYVRTLSGEIIETWVNEPPSPSGAAYSTVEDLLTFKLSHVYSNKLLSDESKVLRAYDFENVPDKTWDELINNERFVNFDAGGAPGINAIIISQPATGYIIIVLANFDPPSAEKLGEAIYFKLSGEEYEKPQIPLMEKFYSLYKSKGKDYLLSNFNDLLKNEDFRMPPRFILNRIGYTLLSENKINEAINIFELNTELFPENGNVWDSLAEAFMIKGENEKAIKHYKKSLQLNPENENAKEKLKSLENK